jgi:hypothetical protein
MPVTVVPDAAAAVRIGLCDAFICSSTRRMSAYNSTVAS